MIDADAAAARPPAADGTVTEGRKGIAYLRDHFVPAELADTLRELSPSNA